MTLSDLLTYLRAQRGGPFYSDLAEAVDIPVLRLVRAERTFSVPDLSADELNRLAEYFNVPARELHEARLRSRGDLTAYLARQEKAAAPAQLRVRGAGPVSGLVAWRDRHAVALRQPDGAMRVVYRSSVDSWGEE
jgi:transcriptional regulator with XRE-family HTH domain